MTKPDQFDGPVPEQADSQLEETHRRKLEVVEFWHRQFKMALVPPDARSNRPALLQTAYRLIKEMCRIKGILLPGDPLCSTLGMVPNPWTTPVMAQEAEEDPGDWKDVYPKLLTVPSPIFLTPEKPRAMADFFEGVKEASSRLHLHLTSEGEIGRRYLLDPNFAHTGVWPEPAEILTFESKVLHGLIKAEMEHGMVEAREALTLRGFLAWEVNSLVRSARDLAIDQFTLSVEEARAMIVLRLEAIISRARVEGKEDLRAEIQAIKLMALILGLGRAEVADDVEGMNEIVKKVSADQERKRDAQS